MVENECIATYLGYIERERERERERRNIVGRMEN